MAPKRLNGLTEADVKQGLKDIRKLAKEGDTDGAEDAAQKLQAKVFKAIIAGADNPPALAKQALKANSAASRS